MIVTTAQLYQVTYSKFAVGACNINNMEQCLGLFRDTDGRLVWTRVHREFFHDYPEQFGFRPPEKLSSKNMPTSSRTKTRSSARPVNPMKSGRA
jgi:hypothetical protein